MILDFHAHIYPEALAPRVIDNIVRMKVPHCGDGTRKSLEDSMRRSGITHAVILNIATRRGQSDSIIDFALSTREHKDPTAPSLIPFASLHPYDRNWKEQLHKIKKLGFPGVKLHPDYQEFYIDDPSLEPFYREAASLGLILVFHAGFDVISANDPHASPERIANVLPLLELGRTVIAHMGGIFLPKKGFNSQTSGESVMNPAMIGSQRGAYDLLCGRNIYLDTSCYLWLADQELVRDMIRKHGPERILFGSDFPWCGIDQSVNYLTGTLGADFLSKKDLDGILYGNGAALLGLESSAEHSA